MNNPSTTISRCKYLHFTWRSSNGRQCRMNAKVDGYCLRHGKIAAEAARKKVQPEWRLQEQDGEPNQWYIVDTNGRWVIGLKHNGDMPMEDQRAVLQRIVELHNADIKKGARA